MAKFTVTMEETVVWSTEIEAENADEARRYCFEHRGEDPDLDSWNNPDTAECVDFNVTDINPVDPESDDGLHSDD